MTESNGGRRNGGGERRHGEADPTSNVRELVDAETRRQDDLREKDSDHIRELLSLRAEFSKELRQAETARIDAIRAVDVGAGQRREEVQAAQAQVLAAQVATSAEALRTQVATTAAAFDAKLTLALEPIQKRLDDLSRAQFAAEGQRAQVMEARDVGSSRTGSLGLWIAAAAATITLFVGAAAIVVTLILSSP